MVTLVVGEEAEEVVEIVVVAAVVVVAVKVAKETRQAKVPVRPPDIPEPSTLIFQPETGRGVGCISNSDGVHFSVQTRPSAHGKTSTPPSQLNNEK